MQQLAAAILGLLTSLYPAIDKLPLRPPSTVNPAEFSNRPVGLLLTDFLAVGAGITADRVGLVIKPTAVLLASPCSAAFANRNASPNPPSPALSAPSANSSPPKAEVSTSAGKSCESSSVGGRH